jgi:hypothetical protein
VKQGCGPRRERNSAQSNVIAKSLGEIIAIGEIWAGEIMGGRDHGRARSWAGEIMGGTALLPRHLGPCVALPDLRTGE